MYFLLLLRQTGCVGPWGSYCLLLLTKGWWGQVVIQQIVIRRPLGAMLWETLCSRHSQACWVTVKEADKCHTGQCTLGLHKRGVSCFEEWVGESACAQEQRGNITDVTAVWDAMEKAQQTWVGVWWWKNLLWHITELGSPISSGDTEGLYAEAGIPNEIQILEIKFWGWRGLGLPAWGPMKSRMFV